MRWQPFPPAYSLDAPLEILFRSWEQPTLQLSGPHEGPNVFLAAGPQSGPELPKAYAAADYVIFSFWQLDHGRELLDLGIELAEWAVKRGGSGLILVLPPGASAESTAALNRLAETWTFPVMHDPQEALNLAAQLLAGKTRAAGQEVVPLYLRDNQHFMDWFRSQEAVGNRLNALDPYLAFRVGKPKEKATLLFWGAHVNVHIKAENRDKTNEIVLSRPDIYHMVAWCEAGNDLEVALVREFRSPARTADGYIHETAGGSAKPGQSALDAAIEEFEKETGFTIRGKEFQHHRSRQVAGTASAHHAHVFSVRLTPAEMAVLKEKERVGKPFGEQKESERTFVEVTTLRKLMESDTLDWANLGMVLLATHP